MVTAFLMHYGSLGWHSEIGLSLKRKKGADAPFLRFSSRPSGDDAEAAPDCGEGFEAFFKVSTGMGG